MNITINRAHESKRLPEVGEIWKGLNSSNLYLRVDDSAYKAAKPESSHNKYFYSLDLETFEIVYTWIDSSDFIIVDHELRIEV